MSQNTQMDKWMQTVGLPVPAPTVVMSVEYESLDHLADMLKDPALQKLFAESDNFGFRQGANAFAADIITKIDAPSKPAGINVICVYSCPPHLSAEQFAQKMEAVMDKITALPIAHRFSGYSLNPAVETHLQELGYPKPEPLVVVRAEAENLDHMIEIFEHSEVARLLTEGIQHFGFHAESDNPAESCCFSADVATKINNY
ncbi:hypothetical protein DFH09DRAFT_582827 [Mycena vulgaris]|nr:hypothetical protein DFH09DRAFT_582827 [Mycena vulgaris]